ncbi:MAG TPA: condensation domain-containing protein, partial [Longimicrobium sp.]|nr:condensation domain-containing protein [Longimicrobium sp.]
LRADDGVRLPPLLPREDGADAPLSFSQERLWLLQRIAPRSPAYNISTVLRFGGALDAGAMERAVAEIVRRHHALRTVILQTDAGPLQRVTAGGFPLPLHDLASLPADQAESEARERVRREWMTPFEIEGGALFRAMLIRIAADDHVLHLAAHHTVFDGWSAGVLQRELATLYEAFSRGEPSPLADLPVQYADYAAWQRGWMTDEAAGRQVAYWRDRLEGAPPLLELPTDRPRPAVQGYAGGMVESAIEPGLVAGVRALARREGATPFMVLLAALDVVLSRWSGQEDLVVGTQVAGRTHAGTEPLIGVFLNTLAIRADLSGAPGFRELLGRVREATLGAYAHQDVPFERVLDALRVPRMLGHSPVFQVMINYQNFGAGSAAPASLERRPFADAEPTSKVDMTLYASEDPQGIALGLVYSAELFEAPRMRELLAQVTAVLEQAVADAGRSVAEMPLRTAEAAALLPDPSQPLDRTWRGSVPEIFARRAGERPGALAVADPLERWTYAELDAATARIARRLAEGGVRPGDTVAIWAHRSAAMARAMVGVLRAGAAFVALDPAY